jgi:hypothetical protein
LLVERGAIDDRFKTFSRRHMGDLGVAVTRTRPSAYHGANWVVAACDSARIANWMIKPIGGVTCGALTEGPRRQTINGLLALIAEQAVGLDFPGGRLI